MIQTARTYNEIGIAAAALGFQVKFVNAPSAVLRNPNRPLLFVLDCRFSNKSEVEQNLAVLMHVVSKNPQATFVALASAESLTVSFLRNLFRVGVGVVFEPGLSQEALHALLSKAIQGRRMVSPAFVPMLIEAMLPKEGSEIEPLSDREQEILRLLASGCSYQEIALRVVLTIDGVRYHLRNIYQKLNVKRKVDAIRYALINDLAA